MVDDADTVEPGKLQLNSDFQFVRTSSTSLYLLPINPVLGLNPRLELGAIFGYQWRVGSGSTATTGNAGALTDLTISPKFRLWEGLDDKLKFSARVDLKLPTASGRHGLGTGDPDIGLVGIATYKLGKTSFDSNVGYYAIDISRADFDNDRWFIGEAVRHELNKEWTVLAEAYGLLPNTRAGGSCDLVFQRRTAMERSRKHCCHRSHRLGRRPQQPGPDRHFRNDAYVLNRKQRDEVATTRTCRKPAPNIISAVNPTRTRLSIELG